jgi:hypothetical protein
MDAVKHEHYTMGDGKVDPFSTAVNIAFDLGNVLVYGGEWTPSYYRPGIGVPDIWEGFASDVLTAYESGEIDGNDIRHCMDILMRYVEWCRLAGMEV